MSYRVRGLAAALVSVVLAATASPALAKPPTKPGAPGNLALLAFKLGGVFDVTATWTAGRNATRYAVRLSSAGVTLDSGTVTALSWTGHTTVPDGTPVTVTVTSYNGTRKGASASRNLVLPDLTAPAASYSVTHNPANVGPDVTVTADSLADNLTPIDNLTQTIDWGDGTAVEPWPPLNTTISHVYADTEARYEASVTVKDAANNTAVYPVVIVVKDTAAPTGSFALSTGSAWASWTKVGVSQAAIHDNLSPDAKIARVINWGDGAQSVWAQGTNPTHRYAAAGSYSPTVKLTDEAGNSSDLLPTSTVVVTLDTVKPVVKVTVPRFAKKRVASWRILKGTATDAQTGVRNVELRVIEKRGTTWYAYNGTTRKWAKAATKARAWAKTVVALAVPSSGAWHKKILGLTKGTLIFKARAVDNVSNVSAWMLRKAVLTKR